MVDQMRFFLIALLVTRPSISYATIGLDGLVLFDYLFYIIVAISLLIQIIIFLKKKDVVNSFPLKIILLLFLTLPMYYYLSVSPHVYWLCLLHLWLLMLVITRHFQDHEFLLKLSLVAFGFALALITPNLINLYKYIPFENNPLNNEQTVLFHYSNKVIELESGLYYQYLSPQLETGDIVELKEYSSKYYILRKIIDYTAEERLTKKHLFNFPLFTKKYNKYKKFQPTGHLVKCNKDVDFKGCSEHAKKT